MSGQGRGNYTRKAGAKRKRLTNAEKAVKMFKAPSTARAHLSQAGVPGAKAYMGVGIQQPQEIKNLDVALDHNPLTGSWSYISSAALALIRVGAGPNQRVGRKIRLMGILLRCTVYTGTAAQTVIGQPYSMHLIKDTQCNGNVPGTTTVYATPADRNSLPSSLHNQRFNWLKAVEVTQGLQTSSSMVTYTHKCNMVVFYDADTGLVSDLERNNIILAFSADTATPTIKGTLRFTYVDA